MRSCCHRRLPEWLLNGVYGRTHPDIGFLGFLCVGLGTMIAAGIFSLSGQAVAVVGSSAIISFVIADPHRR